MQEIDIDGSSIEPQGKRIKLDVSTFDQELINIHMNLEDNIGGIDENLAHSIIIPPENPLYRKEEIFGNSHRSHNHAYNASRLLGNSSVLIKSIIENISAVYSSNPEILLDSGCFKDIYQWNYPKFKKESLYSKKCEEIMNLSVNDLFGHYKLDNYITEMLGEFNNACDVTSFFSLFTSFDLEVLLTKAVLEKERIIYCIASMKDFTSEFIKKMDQLKNESLSKIRNLEKVSSSIDQYLYKASIAYRGVQRGQKCSCETCQQVDEAKLEAFEIGSEGWQKKLDELNTLKQNECVAWTKINRNLNHNSNTTAATKYKDQKFNLIDKDFSKLGNTQVGHEKNETSLNNVEKRVFVNPKINNITLQKSETLSIEKKYMQKKNLRSKLLNLSLNNDFIDETNESQRNINEVYPVVDYEKNQNVLKNISPQNRYYLNKLETNDTYLAYAGYPKSVDKLKQSQKKDSQNSTNPSNTIQSPAIKKFMRNLIRSRDSSSEHITQKSSSPNMQKTQDNQQDYIILENCDDIKNTNTRTFYRLQTHGDKNKQKNLKFKDLTDSLSISPQYSNLDQTVIGNNKTSSGRYSSMIRSKDTLFNESMSKNNLDYSADAIMMTQKVSLPKFGDQSETIFDKEFIKKGPLKLRRKLQTSISKDRKSTVKNKSALINVRGTSTNPNVSLNLIDGVNYKTDEAYYESRAKYIMTIKDLQNKNKRIMISPSKWDTTKAK